MVPDGAVVGRCIVSATFEEWISHVFAHPPEQDNWWQDSDALEWNVPPSETVPFLARTFKESGSLLKPFTDDQAGSGLWYICSEIAFSLCQESVPLATRKDAIACMRELYSDCFNTRCSRLLSHLNEASNSRLNVSCYMLWDLFPYPIEEENTAHEEISEECLRVMELALGLESDACRESALHGLGHWFYSYPEQVGRAIDRFLEAYPNARPELLAYARKARTGEVQ